MVASFSWYETAASTANALLPPTAARRSPEKVVERHQAFLAARHHGAACSATAPQAPGVLSWWVQFRGQHTAIVHGRRESCLHCHPAVGYVTWPSRDRRRGAGPRCRSDDAAGRLRPSTSRRRPPRSLRRHRPEFSASADCNGITDADVSKAVGSSMFTKTVVSDAGCFWQENTVLGNFGAGMASPPGGTAERHGYGAVGSSSRPAARSPNCRSTATRASRAYDANCLQNLRGQGTDVITWSIQTMNPAMLPDLCAVTGQLGQAQSRARSN